MTTIRGLIGAALVLTCFGAAVAKLPPPTAAQRMSARGVSVPRPRRRRRTRPPHRWQRTS